MKLKKILLLFLLVTCTTITSCGNNSNQDYVEEYTVIWQDYNGDILELDRNVKEGSLPSYDGSNPTREKTNKYNYTFVGWEPEISAVYEKITIQLLGKMKMVKYLKLILMFLTVVFQRMMDLHQAKKILKNINIFLRAGIKK